MDLVDDGVVLITGFGWPWTLPGEVSLIASPSEPGRYPVVEFLHGFSLSASQYVDTVRGLAACGLVVVAPTLYKTGVKAVLPGGSPSSEQERDRAAYVAQWCLSNDARALGSFLPPNVKAVPGKITLVGHSRGGAVALAVGRVMRDQVLAVVLLDPVDGDAFAKRKVLDGDFTNLPPVAILGCKISIAPDRNYWKFYEALAENGSSPALIELETAGHLDFCDQGPQPLSFRVAKCFLPASDPEQQQSLHALVCELVSTTVKKCSGTGNSGVRDALRQLTPLKSLGIDGSVRSPLPARVPVAAGSHT